MPFVSLKDAYNQLDIHQKAEIIKPKDSRLASIVNTFSTKIFASYDEDQGWSFKTLGFWDRVLRQLGIKHKDTILSKDSYLDSEHHFSLTLAQQETTSQKSGDLFKVVIQKIATAKPAEIKQLDEKFVNLEYRARLISKDVVNFRKNLIVQDFDENQRKKYKDFECHLKSKLSRIFLDPTHSSSTLQRVLWQDQTFLTALSDPIMVQLFLWHFKGLDELDLGNGIKLSSLIFEGLSNHKLSYLMTVNPIASQQRMLTQVDLTKALAVFENFKNALTTYDQSLEKEFEIKNLIHISTPKTLIKAINDLNVRSVNLQFAKECFEGMSLFGDQLDLANGLISKALDSEHLAAALSAIHKKMDSFDQTIQNGMEKFVSLIDKLQNNQLDPQTEYLMTVRLQQILIQITNESHDLEQIKASLT